MSDAAPIEIKSDTPALPRLAYSMAETAELLGLSYQTVYRLNKRGLLNSSSALRHKLFPLSEIERFLQSTLPKQKVGK
jgi:excisionase family DNA binding protein